MISNKTFIGYYSFDKSFNSNNALEVTFKNEITNIKYYLSAHPLDMPWNLKVTINDTQPLFEYEGYPNLLKNPDTLGNELAIKLAKDITSHIKTKC